MRRTLIVKRMARLCIFINLAADPEVALPHNASLFQFYYWPSLMALDRNVSQFDWFEIRDPLRLPLNIASANSFYGNNTLDDTETLDP